MKRIMVLFALLALIFTGCNNEGALRANDYKNYKCYDVHLCCLDAYETQVFLPRIEEGEIRYSVTYRKPVGVSDNQFICASVKEFLSFPQIVIMQNPDNYVDVLQDWTIKKIELYYVSHSSDRIEGKSKPIYEEDEPALKPVKIIGTTTDIDVFNEFLEFVLNSNYSMMNDRQNGFYDEKKNSEIDDNISIYIRVHFNEAENIVWDSRIAYLSSSETQQRYITIDKSRTPENVASTHLDDACINDLPQLYEWIYETIEEFNN